MKTIQLISLLFIFFGYTAKSGTIPCIAENPLTKTFPVPGKNILTIDDASWTGLVNTDWNESGNWSSDVVPTSATNVTIGSGAGFYPEVTTVASVNNLIIQTGGMLTISGGTLQIAADITNSGIFDVSNGTIEMIGSVAQTIPSGAISNNILKNLIISNDVSLGGLDTLTGTLTIADGKTFSTNNNLILRSDANGTARIETLPVDGSGNATAFITGKVNIERYIPLRKAWRLLSAPVSTIGAPTINQAWQEGVGTPAFADNPNPGYGVLIQGGLATDGFDQGLSNSPFVKIYNNATNSLQGLPTSPGTLTEITNYPGYFLYIRGDRSIDLMQGTAAAITATTLRMKGNVNTGDQLINVNATNYTVLGNPFASAIDFETLTRDNVKNTFYVWDPELAGSYGLGGYVTLIWNSGSGDYDITTSASPISKYIPSGAAVFIESEDGINPGTVTIKESDKTSNGSDAIFGRVAPIAANSLSQKLRVNLYSVNANSTNSLLDAVLTTYDAHNLNIVDNNDAKKLNGGSENIGIKRNGKMLSIERRETITVTDTTFLNIYQMKIANYQLQVVIENMNRNNMTAVIKDKYSNTINNMQLDMNGTTSINFNINADPASYATDRFSIVFLPKKKSQLALEIHKAFHKEKDIAVEWKPGDENNIKNYEVERSADGKVFTKINTTAVNEGTAMYEIIDTHPLSGINYYRVRSINTVGKTDYSDIIKVDKQVEKAVPSIKVYPNPVEGNIVSVQLNNIDKGNYSLQLYNSAGQLVAVKTINYSGKGSTETLDVKKRFTAGKYELKLIAETFKISAPVIKQ